uniref:JNK-interacting protein leucine zipper II domain-containing protein n=1 Tax=Timema cristinae TaxID=61476 RepID=A0A7R9CNS4_TIMCR|nr:unnamed protein product [Timema cristinae]
MNLTTRSAGLGFILSQLTVIQELDLAYEEGNMVLKESSGPVSFGFTSLEANMRSMTSAGDFAGPVSPPDSNHSNTSLRNELQGMHMGTETGNELPSKNIETSEKGQLTDAVTLEHRGTVTRGAWVDSLSPSTKDSTPELEDIEDIPVSIVSPIGRTKTKKEQRSGNTLYQELSFQDAEALGEMDDGADITDLFACHGSADSDDESQPSKTVVHAGSCVSHSSLMSSDRMKPGSGDWVVTIDFLQEAAITSLSSGSSVKNALNIVKDDLIVKVDELTSDQEILREEIRSLQTMKTRLQEKIHDLEEELKRVKEEAEKSSKATKSDDECCKKHIKTLGLISTTFWFTLNIPTQTTSGQSPTLATNRDAAPVKLTNPPPRPTTDSHNDCST